MFDKHIEISFSTYYLTEFFSKTLEFGADKVPEDQYELLQELSAVFMMNPEVMDALEKLAQYQGTNELSIFLFDLSERLKEYPARKSIDSLPSIAEDFINLFRLMMEEKESVRDLGMVIDYYNAQKPVAQLADTDIPEVQTETNLPVEEKETLSFNEFYFGECARLEEMKFAGLPQSDQEAFGNVLSALRGFTPEEKKSYDPLVLNLHRQAQSLYSAPDTEKYDNLESHFSQLFESIRSFKEEKASVFKQIAESGSIEPLPEKESKPLTVDELLEEYFISVVDDHVQQIRDGIELLNDSADFNPLLKTLRSLKELSMIHGYNGMESLAEQILFSLASAHDKEMTVTESTQAVLNEVLQEFNDVNKYKNSDQANSIHALANKVLASFAEPAPPEMQAEPVEEQKEESTIAFTDRTTLLQALQETIRTLYGQIQKQHSDLSAPDKIQISIRRAQGACELLHKEAAVSILGKISGIYAELSSLETAQAGSALKRLETVWEDFIAALPEEETDSKAIEIALDAVIERGISIENDLEIRKALTETLRAQWSKISERFKESFTDAAAPSRGAVETFLNGINQNAHLLGYNGLQTISAYFSSLLAKNQNYPEELAEEIQKSFELMLDRLHSAGKEADYSDIMEILDEVLVLPETPEEKEEEAGEDLDETTETAEEPEKGAPLSEEEELEQDFIAESRQELEQVRQALAAIQADSSNRAPFKTIGNGMHAIRSSAHLLQKNKIGDFAVSIEEAAEMYEAEEMPLPEGLVDVLSQSVALLERLIQGEDADTSGMEAKIDDMLNALITENTPQEEIPEAAPEEEEVLPDEKPLFADDEDFDDDLLDIFREESAAFIATLAESNAQLKDDLHNEEALNNLDYAAHSLRSSAKMLSFQEITQLTAGLENVVEAIKAGAIENSLDIQNDIEQTIEMIQRLQDGEEVPSAELSAVVQLLDVVSRTPKPEEASHKPDKEAMNKVFLDEATELLEALNQNFLELENIPESTLLLNEILRHLHTLKGSAMMVDFTKIGNLAHKLEDYFQVFKEKDSDAKQEMLNPAFTALDLIQEMCQSIAEGQGEAAERFTAKLAELDNKLFYYQNFDQASLVNQPETGAATEPKVTTGKRKDKNVIKIDTGYLDNLVNMATELVVNRTELTSHFDNLKKMINEIESGKKQLHQLQNLLEDFVEGAAADSAPVEPVDMEPEADEDEAKGLEHVSENFKKLSSVINSVTSELNYLSRDFEKNIQQISNLSKTLHNDILRVRMVPVENLFERFGRPVRDLAKAQGKRVTVSIEGNNAEMDRAMIEALADPVMHILRNAVGHGIEDGETRKANNKPKIGKISLSARQEKSQVVIDITDDGRGIDLEAVKKTAIKRGLVTKSEAAKLSEAEILDFIFYPEFTTKTKATDVSGRGVGLDVVANQIQKLKGVIRIHTEKGVGTTFSIRVPLTLIISQALMTRIYNHAIAIPLIAVQESQEMDPSEILIDDNRRYVQAHGKLLPYIPLNEIFNFGETQSENEETIKNVLILHDAGISVALGIGDITGRQEIVIKALGDALQNVEFVAGGTILGNGEVALILDYASVIRSVETQFFGHMRGRKPIKSARGRKKTSAQVKMQIEKRKATTHNAIEQKIISGRKPQVLIVDDSSSVRSFVSGVLEKSGYVSIRATDGLEALEILKKETIDLMITDLEMPNMDGFSLISEVRANSRYDDLPIVILTGRSGKAQREKGAALGANSFIGKPFKEGDLIKVISDFVSM